MARPPRSSFQWPGHARSAAIERAAERAADRGLERLRERQRRRRAPMPSSEPGEWPSPTEPPSPPPASSEPEPAPEPAGADPWEELERDAEPRASDAEQPRAHAKPVLPGHLWEEEFDALADELVNELRRDLGPGRDQPLD